MSTNRENQDCQNFYICYRAIVCINDWRAYLSPTHFLFATKGASLLVDALFFFSFFVSLGHFRMVFTRLAAHVICSYKYPLIRNHTVHMSCCMLPKACNMFACLAHPLL